MTGYIVTLFRVVRHARSIRSAELRRELVADLEKLAAEYAALSRALERRSGGA
jgi:hypothetical protein